jgi:outer membrane protein assembly factor BamB
MSSTTFTTICCLALIQGSALAGNWAHWRGPTGNGAAPDARPPVEWSATKNVKWKVAVPGRGSGSPVIWGDRVFVVSAIPAAGASGFDGERLSKLAFKLFCFDRGTGKLVWERTATEATPHEGTHSTNGFASASPCTDGKHVYAHFGSRGLFCYKVDGTPVWKREDLGKMRTRNQFGEGSSPTLVGDKILVPWDHEGPSALYALDRFTGKTIWKADRAEEPTCWATPLVVEHQGKRQVIMNGQTCARSYDLETGRELWRCAGQTQRPVASAVVLEDLVIIGSGFRGSFIGAFRLDGRGDIEGSNQVVWTLNRNTPDIASPLISGDRLYFYKGKSGMLTCVDAATGKAHYSAARIPEISSTYASPIAAGGHVYLTGRSGTTVVIKDGAELEIVSTNSVGEGVDATPAPVDNELFIRGENHLFCISKER